jgi:hypothetical protein
MDSEHSKKDTDCPTTRFSRTATRAGCPPESAGVETVEKVLLQRDVELHAA